MRKMSIGYLNGVATKLEETSKGTKEFKINQTYQRTLEHLEDIELNAIADARKNQNRVRVNLDEL